MSRNDTVYKYIYMCLRNVVLVDIRDGKYSWITCCRLRPPRFRPPHLPHSSGSSLHSRTGLTAPVHCPPELIRMQLPAAAIEWHVQKLHWALAAHGAGATELDADAGKKQWHRKSLQAAVAWAPAWKFAAHFCCSWHLALRHESQLVVPASPRNMCAVKYCRNFSQLRNETTRQISRAFDQH